MKAKLISQVEQKRIVLQDEIPLKTPLVIYTEPSGYCNLRCKFCPQSSPTKELKKDMMTVNTFKKSIDDLLEFPDKINLLRVCGNGEPLMNKNILEMLQYAKEKDITKKIVLVSNGLLLNDNLIKNIPKYIDEMVISIEGLNSNDYQQVCERKADFNGLIKNLNKLYKNKKECSLYIKTHHRAINSKIDELKFMNMFENICDKIFIEKLVPIWNEFKSVYNQNEFRYEREEIVKKQVCPQIFKGLQIMANGEVLPCCVDWKRYNKLGNLNEISISDIWNGRKLRELQIKHLNGEKDNIKPCKSCSMNDYSEVDNLDSYKDKCLNKILKNEKDITFC